MISFYLILLIVIMHISFWFGLGRYLVMARNNYPIHVSGIIGCVAIGVVTACGHVCLHLYIKELL